MHLINPTLEEYLEHVPGALAIDPDGKIIYMNEQCAEYLEVDRESSIGKKILEIFPETKMLEGLKKEKSDIVFYNSQHGIGISIHVPIFRDGKKIALLEYDIAQRSELLYELADGYTMFLDEELKYLKSEIKKLRTKYSIDNIVGVSHKITEMKEQIKVAAATNSTVIISGETGTGKELVAHSIHQLSKRFARNFVKINAATLPESLAESELFGYDGGSFTGAKTDGKKGKFQLADHGTLFIDEISQMPDNLQPKLLRVLQEKEIDKIGGDKSIPIDVRIITATNEDLLKLISKGRFREDLYYRLNVIEIHTPALRDHLEDIPCLVENFVDSLNVILNKKVTKIDKKLYSILQKHHWPGNVRELQNVIERAMNKVTDDELNITHFDFEFLTEDVYNEIDKVLSKKRSDRPIDDVRNKAEMTLIIKVLERFNGNKTKAAEFLNIPRPLLYQKMNRLGIKNER